MEGAMAFGVAVFATLVAVSSMSPPEAAAAAWTQHVPQGWKLVDRTEDQGSEVLVIEKDDPLLRVANESLGPKVLNTNPRKMLFIENQDGKAKIVGSADHFLPSEHNADLPCLIDPLEEGGVNLEGSILTARFSYWLSCGSYDVTRKTFTFRRDNGRYRLIGYDVSSFSRSTGQGQELSINYLTGRKKRTTGIAFLESNPGETAPKPKVAWSKVGRAAVFLDAIDMKDCETGGRAVHDWCVE